MPRAVSSCVVVVLVMVLAANVHAARPPCATSEWRCHSSTENYCILSTWMCDGMMDCADNSDESFCDGAELRTKTQPGNVGFCYEGYFECLSQMKCVAQDLVCDGKTDCDDGSDEVFCKNNGLCDSGMKLDSDAVTCVDIDECAANTRRCDHDCINTQGSYYCTCELGYLMSSDKHGCIVDNGTLIISNSRKVHLLSRNGEDEIILDFSWQFDDQIRAIEYDYGKDKLYMAVGNSVFQSQRHGRAYCLIENVPRVSDIAFDWATDNLYLAFEDYEIQVCRSDGYFCRKLIWRSSEDQELKRIHQLIVHPRFGLMFWRGCYETNRFELCFIEMASMDGEERTVLAHHLYDLSAMALDFKQNTLYFSRFEHGLIIESIQIEQTEEALFQRKAIFKGKQGRAPMDMLFHSETLFLANENGVSSLKLITENKTKEEKIREFLTGKDYSMAMNQSLYQDPSIRNRRHNRLISLTCDHLYILKSHQPTYWARPICFCANGYKQNQYHCSQTQQDITREPRMCVQQWSICYVQKMSSA